jgi:hypothetical protein
MVYVDTLTFGVATDAQAKRVGARNGNLWCHLIADTQDELRVFAASIGLRSDWIQHAGSAREHFDLTPGRRARAVKKGAKEISQRELVAIIQRKREKKP